MADVIDLSGETLVPDVVSNEKTDDVEVASEGVSANTEILFGGLKLRIYSEIDRKVKINPKGMFTFSKDLAEEAGITESKNNVVISCTEDMSKIVLFASNKKETYSFAASFRAVGPKKRKVCQLKANSIAHKFPNQIANSTTFNTSILEENGVKALVIDISK